MEQEKSLSTPLNRITVVDALRGFALLGVILIHMLQHYGIFSFANMGVPREAQFPVLDEAIRWLSDNVISGRFINIFAFLFGLSFFIQMDRAAKKGTDFRARFIWRMAILFIIGLIGNCFYTGDIMSIYAVFGIILVLFYRFKSWILILIATLLLLGAPRIIKTGYENMTKTEQVQNQDANTQRPAFRPPMNMEEPSFLNSAKNNLTRGMDMKLNYQFGMFGRGFVTLALFILGFIVGRIRFFEEVDTRKKRNLILFAGFVIAVTAINWIIDLFPPQPTGFFMRPDMEITPTLLTVMALKDVSSVLFSGALIIGFIILYQMKGIGKCLDIMTPYGRMGLTNYEMQSVIGCLIFSMWAFGSIFGDWGRTEVFALGLVIYTMQVIISKYWMKYFLYGPFEWLWRSATYLKIQPFRRK
ncbi:MAG: DUF418 domain-containing protein [Prevotella sp.]|jgi:uncharacterized protein|nr:DUF418 domain-containing protein [Prevotella sp.]